MGKTPCYRKAARLFQEMGYITPKEIALDKGTNLDSEETEAFYIKWGIMTHILSAHLPQSNECVEAAVKAAKWVLRSNMGVGGSMHNNKATQAVLK